MIEGWEKETAPLTEQEKAVAEWVAKGLRTKLGRAAAITNSKMRAFFVEKFNANIPEARIRKVIHHLSVSGTVKLLVANNKGYYCARAPEDVQRYIRSLRQRSAAIERRAKALEGQLAAKLHTGQLFETRTASAKT